MLKSHAYFYKIHVIAGYRLRSPLQVEIPSVVCVLGNTRKARTVQDAGFGDSRKVNTTTGSSTYQQVEAIAQQDQMESFSTPLVKDPGVTKERLQTNSMMLLTDIMGSNFGQGKYISVRVKPAMTLKVWMDAVRLGDVRFDRLVVIVLVGTNQVLEFQRKIVISQMIALLHAIKDKVNDNIKVMASGLVPRCLDHVETTKLITQFSYAVHVAVIYICATAILE